MNTAYIKILKARTGLVLEHPFFGSLCLRMQPQEDIHCATAWTDGRTLGYNPNYVNGLRDDQVQGLMAHTVMHPACQHHTRRNGRDHALWNTACDYAINWILLDAGITLPPKYLDTPAWHGMTADEIYTELTTHTAEESRPVFADGEGESAGDVDLGGVEGASSEGNEDNSGAENGAGASDESGQVDDGSAGEASDGAAEDLFGDPGGSGEVRDGVSSGDGGGSAESGPDEDWERALAQAVQKSRDVGDLPGELERLVNDVLNPKIDWQELLSRYICDRARDDYSWTPPNKRFVHLDVILPSLSHQKLPELVLAVDTSGSVTVQEMDQFAAEVSGILDAFDTTVHIVYCDAHVAGSETFDRADLPLKLSPKGGGGTDYRPVFQWIEQRGMDPACLVFLTDLECLKYPDHEPDYPVLWACIGRGGVVPPFGERLEIC
ncbi:hypothetical protein GO013_04350 [Pseudodesulfovibrio sp. JC047]|uniref:vWA domain-containing protein n=1 Tax=Pseudodesulfovibrio sp. JC047 TaxID=2683199 RepID=UPI0013D81B8A|nr:VWA-like domain-containing protein [Pseudodesulfovibrio sp. JC047]NDV18650.1 hypothetical protein [Pseudodesulfovibrio sp. JC047]